MKEKIVGGVGDKKKDSQFNTSQLNQGITVEMEHTNDPKIAKEISKDHLTEDSQYYKKLAVMEAKPLKDVIGELLSKHNKESVRKIISIFELLGRRS